MATVKKNTVTLESTKAHVFGGHRYNIGDTFEASSRDAKLVLALRRAKFYKPPAPAAKNVPYAAKVIPSEQTAMDEIKDQAGVEKRPYKRRDLVAE